MLLARVYLPEKDLLSVKVGDKVEVIPDRFPDAHTTGEIQFISPSVDAGSGTFQVVIRVRREPVYWSVHQYQSPMMGEHSSTPSHGVALGSNRNAGKPCVSGVVDSGRHR